MTERYPRPTADELPEALTARDQWVCWRAEERNGKPTKVPLNPETGGYASSTNPETWGTFEDAHASATEREYGLGFVFSKPDPFVGIDLDDCRDPETGRPDSFAKKVIRMLDSYTEVSPSGTGYHVIVEGRRPGKRSRRGNVEIYDHARFFTVTGLHVEGMAKVIEGREEELDAVYAEHVAENATEDSRSTPRESSTTLSDSALLRRAHAAKNGEKFGQLWRGRTTGYASQSEADMALCCLLAFWTGGDTKRVDSLFRDSGLMREKWDEQHYADGSTYGEVTVRRAIDVTDEGYEPGQSGHGGSSREVPGRELRGQRAHDVERIRLLEQRVQELEALVRLKQERIQTLESQMEADERSSTDSDAVSETRPSEPDADASRSLIRRFFS